MFEDMEAVTSFTAATFTKPLAKIHTFIEGDLLSYFRDPANNNTMSKDGCARARCIAMQSTGLLHLSHMLMYRVRGCVCDIAAR